MRSKSKNKLYIVIISLILHGCLLVSQAYFMEGVSFKVRTITSDSFESDVIESDDAWILAIKGTKVSEEKWQTEENLLRGVVNVAFVDLHEDEKFWLKKKMILEKDEAITPLAIVFPYGGEKIKKKKYKHVNSVNEAKHIALSSLSEYKVTWLKSKMGVEQFIRASYTSWPPRFPLVLTTEKKITPPLYRALSLKYSRYFNFGIVHSSLAQTAMGLPKGVKVPRMDILISQLAANNTKMDMAALTYDVEKYGPVQYRYLIRFLFSAHEKHWPDLPGSKKFSEELGYEEYYREDVSRIFANPVDKSKRKNQGRTQTPKIQEINYDNHKTICDDSTPGYCVVAFLNGAPNILKKHLTVFTEVRDSKNLQEKVLNFLWINATCYPEYGSTFGVDSASLPALLIAKPHRRYFVKHSGKFNKDSILEFIEKSLSGRLNYSPYSRFDDLERRICSEQSKENETTEDPKSRQDEGNETKKEGKEKPNISKKGRKIDEDL